MSSVIAALDNSPAAAAVLAAARALAAVLDANVEPLHIGDGDIRVVEWVVRGEGLALRIEPGPVVGALVEAGSATNVIATVVGARRTSAGPSPLGGTALAVATSLPKPILIVPPGARVTPAVHRVLVPVEGGRGSPSVPEIVVALAHGADVDVVTLHISLDADLPAFTDQPQHEREAWTREFTRRYVLLPAAGRLQTRVGRPEELIPLVAQEIDADLIALSWSQQFVPGRAHVVRAVLERGRCPVLLIPEAHPD